MTRSQRGLRSGERNGSIAGLHAASLKNLVELMCELRVAFTQRVTGAMFTIGDLCEEGSSLLGHPLGDGFSVDVVTITFRDSNQSSKIPGEMGFGAEKTGPTSVR